MRTILPLLVAAAVGCGGECVPFEEIAVEGGSEASREVVRSALDDFAGWTRRPEVCVERVRLEGALEADDLAGVPLGRYEVRQREISLLEDQPFLYDTTIHELCHAVDFEDDVVFHFPALFELAPFFIVAGDRDFENTRREALALDCEVGPAALALGRAAAARCGTDEAIETLDVLLEVTFPAFEPTVGAAAVDRAAHGAITLPDGFDLLPIGPFAGSTAGELLLLGAVDQTATVLALDPARGELVDRVGAFVAPPPAPDALPGRLFPAGVGELGEAAVTAVHWVLASGEVLRFLALWDDGWALPDDPCLAPGSWVVQVGETPWLVVIDGRTLRWSALVR